MDLRNKKTGKVERDAYIRETHDFGEKRHIAVFVRHGNHNPERVSKGYRTLDELNEDWEDYIPKEPLIKDEKIRKAVRAWAKINEICGAKYGQNAGACWFYFEDYKGRVTTNISFLDRWVLSKSEIGKGHAIEELCGEEEEEKCYLTQKSRLAR